jgi:uncharacterized protein
MGSAYHSLADLPDRLNVFPIAGALLLPRSQLPLSVFEPRYLALIDAAFKGTRLIGVIQPTESEDDVLRPTLAGVGCAGRLTAFHESEDGRYTVTLTGICRFRRTEEAESDAPFRTVYADFAPFLGDLAAIDETGFPRERLLAALQAYLDQRELKADWKGMLGAAPETLVNALAMLCPFAPAEKQALIEAPNWQMRVETLIALLEMANMAPPGQISMN